MIAVLNFHCGDGQFGQWLAEKRRMWHQSRSRKNHRWIGPNKWFLAMEGHAIESIEYVTRKPAFELSVIATALLISL